MRLTIQQSERYQGHLLEFDREQEQVRLLDQNGTVLRTCSWEELVDRALSVQEIAPTKLFPEKRGFARTPVTLWVKVSGKQKKQIESVTCNISGGVLYVETNAPLPLGTPVTMEFNLPKGGKAIRAKGEVAWAGRTVIRRLCLPGMGVEFTDLKEEDRIRLLEFVTAINQQRTPSSPS